MGTYERTKLLAELVERAVPLVKKLDTRLACRWLKDAEAMLSKQAGRPADQGRAKVARKMYKAGKSITDIAAELGVSRQTIYTDLKGGA